CIIFLTTHSSTFLYPFFFHSSRPPRDLHSFPTRRSSDLIRDIPSHRLIAPDTDMWGTGGILGGILFRLGSYPAGAQGKCLNDARSEEHTSELQSRENLVCRLLLEKKKNKKKLQNINKYNK